MIGAGQMRHVCAVPSIRAETLQIIWMRSDDHNVWAHMKFLFRRLAGHVRNPGARIHVGNAKSIDVLRPSSKAVRRPLKENLIEASGLVMATCGTMEHRMERHFPITSIRGGQAHRGKDVSASSSGACSALTH